VSGEPAMPDFGALGFDQALRELGEALASRPEAATAVWKRFADDSLAAGVATMAAANGEQAAPTIEPARGDRRFKDAAWQENPVYSGMLQGYLLWSRMMRELVDVAELDRATDRKARFAVDAMIDALAPTNTLLGNPAALRRAFETGGQSVRDGMERFLDDVANNDGRPRQVDLSQFEIGTDLAASPGSVVFRNELIELIQYAPTTKTVHAVPLLLSPPWINKYYVMDLAPGKSFVEWAVGHGHTVFAISYVNPDSEHRDFGFDDYLANGPLTALDVVQSITGAPRVNVAALCLGGTLAACGAAYLAAGGDDRIGSLTMLNTLLDFAEPGVLGAFADADGIDAVGSMMRDKGYLDASAMAKTFDALRANDLIWNYVSSGWLMGQAPPAFDLLAWNADSTHMPARMHGEYLQSCYVENRLAKGTMRMLGRRIKLDAVKVDAYYVAAEQDHITPWASCYDSGKLLGGDVRFILSSSGHIAGIVNPPGGRRTYRTNDERPASAERWHASSTAHEGTWWNDWATWMRAHGGRRIKPPAAGNDAYPVLGPAPGTYVHQR
jgi:polyhydroxyalkanoate synthase